jgi:iron complex outermembrane receptor protein
MQGALALMFDNERVEVLRGPQGTLFGRNSTVGSINIITAKPKIGVSETSLNIQYGNYDHREFSGIINQPVSDTFALRFAGRYYQRDSYVDGYWDPNQFDQRFIADKVADAEIIAPTVEDCTGPQCYTRTQKSPTAWWADDLDIPIRALVPADKDHFYMNANEWAYRAAALWKPKFAAMSLNLSFQHYQNNSAGGIDLVNCDKLRGRPQYDLDDDWNIILDDDGNPSIIGRTDCSSIFPKDDTYQAVVNVPGKLFLDIKYLRANYTWDIKDNLRFVALAGLEDQDRRSAQDMDHSLNAWDQAMFFLDGTGSTSWMHEFQLQSYGNERWNWIAGVNYFYEKTSTIGYFDNAIDEKALWDQPNRSTTAAALFAQGTYSYSPKWHLTIGARYSDETKEDKGGRTYLCNLFNECGAPEVGTEPIDNIGTGFEVYGFDREILAGLPTNYYENPNNYTNANGTPEDPTDDYVFYQYNDNKGSWNHDDWRVGLDYQMNDDTLLYAYLATGFKAGGIGDVFEGTVVDGDIDEDGRPFVVSIEEVVLRTAYDPEEVTTLELGLKQRLLDGTLELRGAYFYSDYENMQYASVGSLAWTEEYQLLADPSGNTIDADSDGRPDFGWVGRPLITAYYTQNVPGAQIQGIELEYDWRPWPRGRIHGYASWLDTEITEDWVTKWDYDPRFFFGLDYINANNPNNERLRVNLKGNDLAVSPSFKLHLTFDHAFFFEAIDTSIVPWVTAHWEDDSYLTVWNVDKHTDDMDFVILDEDIRYNDDKREAWSMVHAGIRIYHGKWSAELYGYNLTDEVVQWWGGAAEEVPKGSMSMPMTYGFRVGYRF